MDSVVHRQMSVSPDLLWSDFRKIRLRIPSLLCQLNFLCRCRATNVLPQSFRIKTSAFQGRCKLLLISTQFKLLNTAIRDLRQRIASCELEAYSLFQSITSLLPCNQLDERMRLLHNCVYNSVRRDKLHFRKKFEFLHSYKSVIPSGRASNSVPSDCLYVNLTAAALPKPMERLLQMGPKHSLTCHTGQCKQVIPSIEKVIHNTSPADSHFIRSLTIPTVLDWARNQKSDPTLRLIKFTNKYIDENDLMLCRADKAGVPVVVDRSMIGPKVDEYITSTHSNRLNDDIDHVGPIVRAVRRVAKIPFIVQFLGDIRPPTYTSIPKLFIQIKTHKEGHPIRPLVQNFCSPTRNLESSLAIKCAPVFSSSPFRVSSTVNFLQKLPTNLPIDAVMYTIDVKSLFPSVPNFESQMMMVREFERTYGIDGPQKRHLYDCLTIIRDAALFSWNGGIYQQTQGVPMGSPLSPALAEIFMLNIEREIVAEYHLPPMLWLRYVDDVFLIWQHGEQQLLALLQTITSRHPTIEFTINRETQGVINFLDVLLSRSDEGLRTTVYRKNSTIDNVIPFRSFSYFPHKTAAFRSYVDRAFRLCSTAEALDSELRYIHNIAQKFGYPAQVVDRIINKHRTPSTALLPQDTSNTNLKFVGALPFLGGATYRISRILRSFGYKIGVRPTINIFAAIRRDKDSSPPLSTPGIYSIPIRVNGGERDVQYIGSTARSINTRINEHKNDIRLGRDTTALGQFVIENKNSTPDWNGVSKIATAASLFEIRYRESIEIRSSHNCNNIVPFEIPYVWLSIIRSSHADYNNDNRSPESESSLITAPPSRTS